MPYEVRHYQPHDLIAPPFEVERFETESEAEAAYLDSCKTILEVGGCCTLVDPAGNQMGKIRKVLGKVRA
jgi:hypothetical protein